MANLGIPDTFPGATMAFSTDLIEDFDSRAVFGRKSKAAGRRDVVVSSDHVVSRIGADLRHDAVLAVAVAQ
jgi:hypothetical protein